jgi:ATP-dependent Zn protease
MANKLHNKKVVINGETYASQKEYSRWCELKLLERAGEIVAAMVTELGMAGEPAVSLKALFKSCGGGASSMDRCREILAELYERTRNLLCVHAEALERLSEALMEREVMNGEEVDEILDGLSNDCRDTTKQD